LTRPRVEVLAPGTTVVGLRFRPGAVPSFLALPASELLDRAVEADELWGRAAVALGERVDDAASPVSSGTSSAGWAMPRVQTRWSRRPCGS
jgi:hypothetical protein